MLSALDSLRDARRRRLWDRDKASGRRGEDLAHRFLRGRGCTVVARNYRTLSGSGEIDLVVWDGGKLAFVEVKTRATDEYGPPEQAVNPEKRCHLMRVAREYARKTGTPWERVRFDIVSIVLRQPPEIALLKAAFR